MSELVTFANPAPPLALPDVPVVVRPATMGDVPFIDGLQKQHVKMVGWMPTQQLQGKISAGNVLIAEEQMESPATLGYCIGHDRYFKRDDVGIIYQMNVIPAKHRGLIGATLLKALFDRSAYGCRLYCCWCAQDIQANYFWESLGFVPLAFRAGSAKRSRVHIFWQKRIRAGDTQTPWWYPSHTNAGAMNADRLVLPIPPGTHWSEAKPIILPALSGVEGPGAPEPEKLPKARAKAEPKKAPEPLKPKTHSIKVGGLRLFDPPPPPPPAPVKEKREPKPKVKSDPKLVAAARELRDRYLEEVNGRPGVVIERGRYHVCRAITEHARYDVSKTLEGARVVQAIVRPDPKLLPTAA